MTKNKIVVSAEETINRSRQEIFQAIIDPKHMVHYFISGADSPMIAGKEITWEFSDYNASGKIRVKEVIADMKIVFEWSAAGNAGGNVTVTMSLTDEPGKGTKVSITEDGYDAEAIETIMGQTFGWAHFLLCLKTYVLFNVDLRRGKKL